MDEKSKLKIGLLIDPSRRLIDWEIKIIYEILFSNFAEITCIFYDPTVRKIRKSFFEKHGGYDEDNITEDLEIALRIQQWHANES